MSYVPSTDKRPVYLNSAGFPMTSGKLVYTATANIADLKTIYVDEIGTEGLNPQSLGADGRTATEIYLGEGAYYVHAVAFVGVDPIAEPYPSASWVVDHVWQDYGSDPVIAPDPTVVYTVGTMAELALVNPALHTTVNVLGYYAAGDIAPRMFLWDASYSGDGNLGTVVKYGFSAMGAWIHDVGNSDVLDVRIFGALPMGATPITRNSNLTAATSWLTTTAGANRTLYIPAGTYAVSGTTTLLLNTPTYLDSGVFFRNVSASTTYTLQFNSTYTIQGQTAIKSGLSSGNVNLVFTDETIYKPVVRASWWQSSGIDGTNSFAILANVFASIPIMYSVVIDKRYIISTATDDLYFDNSLIFEGNGRISNTQNTYYLIFNGPATITNNTRITASGSSPTVRGVLHTTLTNFALFKFLNYGSVRSSWFASDTGDGKTVPLNGVMDISYASTAGTRFIFDHPQNVFSSSSLVSAASENLIFEHEQGLLTRATASTTYVVLTKCSFGNEYFIAGSGFVVGGQTNHITNWLPQSPTASDYNNAWKYAVDSALHTNAILDLSDLTIPLTAGTNLSSIGLSGGTIRNGKILVSDNYSILQISGTVESIKLCNITVTSSANSPLLNVGSGGRITNAIISKCFYNSSAASNMVQVTGTGVLTRLSLSQNVVIASCIVYSPYYGLDTLSLYNNSLLQGDLITDNCSVNAMNNKIVGSTSGSGKWQVACHGPVVLTGNSFYQCDLYVLDNNGVIDAVINGNQFESTDAKWSRIVYFSRTYNTYFGGAVATGNSFIGTVTSDVVAIVVGSTNGMGYETLDTAETLYYWANRITEEQGITTNTHQICLTGNHSSNVNIIVPVTQGVVPTGTGTHTINYSMFTEATTGKVLTFYFNQNAGVFYMPGSNLRNTLGYCTISPTYLYISGSPIPIVPQYLGHNVDLAPGGGGNDCIHFAFSSLSSITIAETKAWGISVNLYAGKPST